MNPNILRCEIVDYISLCCSRFFILSLLLSDATAQTQIVWQGHTWNVTNGGMAGVARGNPSNVSC